MGRLSGASATLEAKQPSPEAGSGRRPFKSPWIFGGGGNAGQPRWTAALEPLIEPGGWKDGRMEAS